MGWDYSLYVTLHIGLIIYIACLSGDWRRGTDMIVMPGGTCNGYQHPLLSVMVTSGGRRLASVGSTGGVTAKEMKPPPLPPAREVVGA